MKMSEEMAVRLHRMMWSDMQKELGDKPSEEDRLTFKSEWIEKNFPGQDVLHRCFLCEYAQQMYSDKDSGICRNCPIVWPGDFCNGVIKSYATMPISEILALPAKNESFDKKAVNIHDLSRDIVVGEVAKASGLPVECDIWSHIKAIQDKARDNTRNNLVKELAEVSGRPVNLDVWRHIKAIQEKAVEEYFEKQPAAKMVSMDVDQVFKQYADEQKAPIFLALAEASGLSASNESVKAHVSRIKEIIRQSGRLERSEEIFKALAVYSGVSEGNWSVYDHVQAIMDKASNEKDLNEIEIRKKLKDAIDALKLYQSTLSYESNLPSSAPIADHIKQIREYAFSDGQDSERERIMDKIGEMLNK